MPDIYQYTDYREYLSDYIDEEKAKNPKFSNRYFSNKAGFSSPGLIRDVISKRRNLSLGSILKVVQAIGLKPREHEYLANLVYFERAKTQSEKEYYAKQIRKHKKLLKVKRIEDKQLDYYSETHHAVLRELVCLLNNSDPEFLRRKLVPRLSIKEIKKSIELLEDLGFIIKTQQGYVPESPFLKAGGNLRDTTLVEYQKMVLEKSSKAWDKFRKGDISAHTVTFTMNEDAMNRVRDEIRKCVNAIFKIADENVPGTKRVYQMNVNVFPASSQV